MFKGITTVNRGFEKGFKSVYYAKVHCPVCKEEMYANALRCPNCKTDFTKPPFNKRIEWQNTAMKIVLVFSLIIGIAICFSEAPVVLGIIVGLSLYGLGNVAVQKIQSFKNYHHK